MKVLSVMSGCGGFDLGLEKAGMQCVGQIEIMPYAIKILNKHWPSVPKHTDILTFCVQDGLVKTIQLQVQEKVIKEKEADSGKKWQGCFNYLSQHGFLEKMFQGFYPLMTEKIFRKYYQTSCKSGMAYRGEYLIVNTSESPRDADVCSLSDVLEESVHQKYYLSKKAVQGIIRRSKKWGRGGYVFLQETGTDKTPRMRLLSLQQLESIVTRKEVPLGLDQKTSLEPQLELKKQETEFKDMLPQQSIQEKEDALDEYGKTLILRKLTPIEKERLQGFPENWTLVEE